ncbi:MAG: HNH endonuclease signature motif containing protein [Gemmatimonadales bacterium]|nr:HNH endonuclease signature motif containing protein [Gemmatimonadales bacterium]
MTPGKHRKPVAQRGARAKLRAYFLAHPGEVVEWQTLRDVAGGITEWARRVRELRQLEGMNIETDKDSSGLRPGQYRLVDLKPLPVFSSSISKETRAFVLDRNGFTCQMCGAVAGEPHPSDSSRKTRLHLGHIVDLSHGGTDDPQNLRALCSVCNEGAQNITLPRPKATQLLTQIRRAAGTEQVEVLKWLIRKYPAQVRAWLAKPLDDSPDV